MSYTTEAVSQAEARTWTGIQPAQPTPETWYCAIGLSGARQAPSDLFQARTGVGNQKPERENSD